MEDLDKLRKKERLRFFLAIFVGVFPLMKQTLGEKSVLKKIKEEQVVEELIERKMSMTIFSVICPCGGHVNDCDYKKYYIEDKRKRKKHKLKFINTYFDIPYKSFHSITDTDIWVYVIHEIKSAKFIDNKIIIFDKFKKYREFNVSYCHRNFGKMGVKFIKNKVIFSRENEMIEYFPVEDRLEKLKT